MSRKCTPIADRLWAMVDRRGPDDCWLWKGHRKDNGYVTIGLGGRRGGSIYIHRLSWLLAHPDESLPEGIEVCHTCDVRHCVNPAHLFLGTRLDNVADMWAKGRGPSGQRHGSHTQPESRPLGEHHPGHRLTDDNVIEIRRRLREGATERELGAEFGVQPSNVHAIKIGKIWRHLL